MEVYSLASPDTCGRVIYSGSSTEVKGRASRSSGLGTPNRNNSSKPLYTASMLSLAHGRTCDIVIHYACSPHGGSALDSRHHEANMPV
jgi:hypothetical protein